MKSISFLIFIVFIGINQKSFAQNVGLGTSDPAEKLHVVGNLSAVTANVSSGLYYRDANNWKFPILTYNNALDRMMIGETLEINNDRNIGINPISQTNKLSVSNTILASGDITLNRIQMGESFERFLYFEYGSSMYFADNWMIIDEFKKVSLGYTGTNSVITVEKDVKVEEAVSLVHTSTIKEIRKYTVNADFPNVPSGTSRSLEFNIPGAEVNDMVILTISFDIPGSLIYSQAFVSSPNTVKVKFTNEGSNNQNLGPEDFHFAIIKN